MKHVRRGVFDKGEMPKAIRRFAPSEALHALEEVDLASLKAAGKRLILLDVDNTLLPWRSHDIPASTTEWLAKARELGFEMCVLSNTRRPERLRELCGRMGLDFIQDRFKPSPRMYQAALAKHAAGPEEAVMVGDQLFTDVWGANRTGIDAIWVRPIGAREFLGTRMVSRNMERILGFVLYRYFQPHEGVAGTSGFFGSGIAKQMAKFVSVGVVATVVDWGLALALMNVTLSGGQPLKERVALWALERSASGMPAVLTEKLVSDAALPYLKVGPVICAIVTSYLLNRAARTFAHQESKASVREGLKFFGVAATAAVFNVTFTTLAFRALAGHSNGTLMAAQVVGMAAGFSINFLGQRSFTFRKRETQLP